MTAAVISDPSAPEASGREVGTVSGDRVTLYSHAREDELEAERWISKNLVIINTNSG